jgi:hypothetical protein
VSDARESSNKQQIIGQVKRRIYFDSTKLGVNFYQIHRDCRQNDFE